MTKHQLLHRVQRGNSFQVCQSFPYGRSSCLHLLLSEYISLPAPHTNIFMSRDKNIVSIFLQAYWRYCARSTQWWRHQCVQRGETKTSQHLLHNLLSIALSTHRIPQYSPQLLPDLFPVQCDPIVLLTTQVVGYKNSIFHFKFHSLLLLCADVTFMFLLDYHIYLGECIFLYYRRIDLYILYINK